MSVYAPQRTRRRRRNPFSRIIGALFIIGIVVSALILAAQSGKSYTAQGDPSKDKADGKNVTKITTSDVQAALEKLNWVEQDLLPVNEYSRPGTALDKVNNIVVHYVGNPGTTAAQNRSYYSRLADNHETSASSNFLVGIKGEILACVPVDEVAYCSNWRNEDTLSIECCHPDESGKFTDDTYTSLVRLTAWLCNELGLDSSDVIRHYDVSGKECPKYFVDHEIAWEAFKDDVQEALNGLQAPPESEQGG